MEFVSASMKSVLEKLEGLPSQEDHLLIRDVGGDVQRIKGALASADASFLSSLNGMEDRSSQDDEQSEQRRTWVRNMRDVAYDMEDFVDRIRLQLSRWPEPVGGSAVCAIRRALYRISTLHARYAFTAEIRGLRSRVEDLCGEGCNWRGLDNQQLPSNSTDGLCRPAPLLVEPVGIEQAMEEVSSWFTGVEQDPELRVFAIVGCGGLGKTTLARALLCKFGKQFHSQATVLASWEFNRGVFLRSLLKQIMPPLDYNELQLGGSDGWKDEELCEKVEEQFLEKRYIVVVDDVWNESSWKIIREILPENYMGSRIVVTTRFNSVAQAIGHQQCRVYTLKPLSADDSHSLLQRMLGDDHLCPCGTVCPTSRILNKCGGIPLAIVAVAGLLTTRLQASGSNLITACGSVTSDVENGFAHVENTKNILNLCYNDLPADLKTCFLCLIIFPVGSIISRKWLIRRWIAEGFVTKKHRKAAEEVAEESFSELIRRNLIQPVEVSSSGNVKTFQVHDVILENILLKSCEENFINVVNSYSPGLELAGNKVRWLAIHRSSNPPEEVMKNMNLLHIRSLTALGTMKHLKYFALLQVLDLEGCIHLGTDQLTMICKMYLLKYLSLRRTYIKALPPRICRLHCLETLDIRETNVWRLPRSVCWLKGMVHLLGGDKSRRLPLEFTQGITNMSKLKTLSGIKVDRGSTVALRGIGNLTNLNKLSIYMNVDPEFLLYSPSLTSLAIDDGFTGYLDGLDSLSAPFDNLLTLKLSGKLSKVPHWLSRMHFLEKLTLSLTSLRTDSLALISSLPKLCYLAFSVDAEKQCPKLLVILQENASESGGEIFIPCGFNCLRTLRFSGTGLPLLCFLQGSMPELQRLELRFKMFDGVYGLENLCHVDLLYIWVLLSVKLLIQVESGRFEFEVLEYK
ncbi:hypothetical protein HU200_048934 [Digitaria exilis]|uniref:Uncharacterized protein n=1 Tax=Digitaria exilis TaxID=1010633 RepID=A0A835AUZ8_9POAL|nr:hypothetical protein HU200_048934 [Digitaria exilis]